MARDAQLLALERSVPLADMGLLGLEFVTVEFSKSAVPACRRPSARAGLNQVSAIELRFPTRRRRSLRSRGRRERGRSARQSGAARGDSKASSRPGHRVRLTLRLNRPLKRGDAVTVRASTHYFESSLPFVERSSSVERVRRRRSFGDRELTVRRVDREVGVAVVAPPKGFDGPFESVSVLNRRSPTTEG